MAHVSVNQVIGKTQRVKVLRAQKIKGVALEVGDTVDIPEHEARYLKGFDSVAFIANEDIVADKPLKATR